LIELEGKKEYKQFTWSDSGDHIFSTLLALKLLAIATAPPNCSYKRDKNSHTVWLRFYSTIHYTASEQSCALIPPKEKYFRFWTGFHFDGWGVTFAVCIGFFRDKVFAVIVTVSDQNKSLIRSSWIPFLLMTSGYSATFNGISFGHFLLICHYI